MPGELGPTLMDDNPGLSVTINGATVYTTPTHNARSTKVYSVSRPVWRVWSQWSNVSATGQTTQVSKTIIAATRDILVPISCIMSEMPRSRQPCEFQTAL